MSFVQARTQAARLVWQVVPIERAPSRSIYDTGCGGADHAYRLEENRRQYAAEDRAASARMEVFTSLARALEAQVCAVGVRKVLADWLRYSARTDMSSHGNKIIDVELKRSIKSKVSGNLVELAVAVVQAWNLFVPIWETEAGPAA